MSAVKSSAIIDATRLAHLEADHAALLDLCLRLEDVAEGLRETRSGHNLSKLAGDLKRLLGETQGLEEASLFPDFDRHAGSCFAAMMIERLKAEHRSDRLAAEDLAQTFAAMEAGRCRLSLETVAAMTGGFAESLRRHVESEKMMIETLLVAKAEGREIFA